jgi:hypothetical protein
MKYLLSILAMLSIGLFASCSEEAAACCSDTGECCEGHDHDEGNSSE